MTNENRNDYVRLCEDPNESVRKGARKMQNLLTRLARDGVGPRDMLGLLVAGLVGVVATAPPEERAKASDQVLQTMVASLHHAGYMQGSEHVKTPEVPTVQDPKGLKRLARKLPWLAQKFRLK